jgi:hypothetical protein
MSRLLSGGIIKGIRRFKSGSILRILVRFIPRYVSLRGH